MASAFARNVMPYGLTRISSPLPKLGTLEFVLDTPKVVSKSVAKLEATLAVQHKNSKPRFRLPQRVPE
ncbi:MAG TPA: hypothetical protein VI386_12980 [Candidatus Sulfotelmatobacter sp.]